MPLINLQNPTMIVLTILSSFILAFWVRISLTVCVSLSKHMHFIKQILLYI